MWCVPEIDAEFIDRMEDVLETYARKYNPREPVVCFDERPVVLHADSRAGVEMAPHRIRRRDYEYIRGGTANVFCIVEPLTGRRLTFASANRKRPAFVRALQKIALRYHDAERIHLILDNLNTHSEISAIKALGSLAGQRLWRRFEIHHTPKHASWLNAAEIEASLVSNECLGTDRLVSLVQLISRVSAWRVAAESARRTIEWKFRVHDARRVFRYGGIKTSRSGH